MILEEKHKEFAVRCYARFLTRSEVVEAFLEEFAEDLPPPAEPPDLSDETLREQLDTDSIEAQLLRDHFTENSIATYELVYQNVYGTDADAKFKEDFEKIQTSTEEDQEDIIVLARVACLVQYEQKVEKHYKQVKRDISSQLRRLNIIHRQFPEKYRALFNQTREQYFNDYRGENLGIAENVLKELEVLLGYVKQRIFQEGNEKEAMKFMNLGHQILKTIVAHNAVTGKQEVMDITPQNFKALADSQQALTDQLKTVTQQLAEHTGTSSSKER